MGMQQDRALLAAVDALRVDRAGFLSAMPAPPPEALNDAVRWRQVGCYFVEVKVEGLLGSLRGDHEPTPAEERDRMLACDLQQLSLRSLPVSRQKPRVIQQRLR
jgi:hypothetical protein